MVRPAEKKLALAAALLAALLPAAPACRAQEAAVLAKGSGLYFDAFLDFQKALGRPVQVFDLAAGEARPKGVKTAVAFGARAAALPYPRSASVIVLLAPGFAPPAGRDYTVISSLPEPAQAAAAFRKAQPKLARLAVFHFKARQPGYLAELAAAARRLGYEVKPVPLDGPLQFPDALRSLRGAADAFWLPPEPELITKTSLSVLAEFSCANKVPFYAPSQGLAELGAAAAFAPTTREAAAAAAAALKRKLAGEKLPEVIYPPVSRLTLNEAFARRCGLPLDLSAGEAGR